MPRPFLTATLLTAALLATPARAGDAAGLAYLINDLRANPPACDGQRSAPLAPLQLQPALFEVRLERGVLLENAMRRAGYRAEYAGAVSVKGAYDARAALAAIERPYCALLTSTRFADIGVLQDGDDWVVLLATPYQAPVLADWPDAGRTILAAVNAARAHARQCGARAFKAAPPVAWNDVLGQAALGHSRDMAERVYFDHHESDGSDAAERIARLGYRWSRVGENIASGLGTPEAAVQGWIDSPGHCANLMNPHYTQMGAAYAINRASESGDNGGTLYWTQVFATPREESHR